MCVGGEGHIPRYFGMIKRSVRSWSKTGGKKNYFPAPICCRKLPPTDRHSEYFLVDAVLETAPLVVRKQPGSGGPTDPAGDAGGTAWGVAPVGAVPRTRVVSPWGRAPTDRGNERYH